MIKEEDIIFVTTTLYTKWLKIQSKIINDSFPNSVHLIVDGTKSWPNSWFDWINLIKDKNEKYFIHLDEDFFLLNKEELLKCISKLEEDNIDILGCSDGHHHYRGANPSALNSFLMIGKTEILRDLDFNNIRFGYDNINGWYNNLNFKFKKEFEQDYPFEKMGCNYFFEQEPYYAFMWKLKEDGKKFGYLYPNFDNRLKSTNPRLGKNSIDIGIHMWYCRNWNSDMDVFGLPNYKRYELLGY